MEKYSANYFSGDKEWPKEIIEFYKSMNKLKFLEIGSYEGRSANWICDNMLGDGVLHCVDPWDPWDPSLCDLNTFWHNTERNREKITCHVGKSEYYLNTFYFAKIKFDFIFIDGNHNRDVVLQDAVNSFAVLKPDRYMIFDDYNWVGGVGPADRPKDAIDCFIRCYEPFIKVSFTPNHAIVKKMRDL